jgi:hypothetical protein
MKTVLNERKLSHNVVVCWEQLKRV